MSRVIFTERATPDVPAANKIQLYAKTDGKLYYMADDGIEVEVGGGGGGLTLPLGISDGGTGETTAEDALAALGGIPAATVTDLGDLIVGTGAGTVLPLSAGTNGQLLSANDAEPTGLEWVDPPATVTIPAPTVDGQVLTTNALAPDGYEWADLPAPPTVPTAASTVVAETSFGASSVVGTSTDYARADHTHGTPPAPSVPAAAATVVAETSFGASSAVGTSTDYARADHTHGTPAAPSHSGLTNLSWTASGHTAPTAAVAGFDAGGAAIAVAPSSGYLVLTSKNGFLSWAPYALGLAFSLSTGEDMTDLVVSSPVLITTGTFT